jgi:prevent-host-death family protein
LPASPRLGVALRNDFNNASRSSGSGCGIRQTPNAWKNPDVLLAVLTQVHPRWRGEHGSLTDWQRSLKTAGMREDLIKTIFSHHLLPWIPAMRYSNQVKPISYLKANAAEVLKQLGEQQEPLVITQNGEAKAVLQDVRSYEQTQETLALLKILALGNQEIEAGKLSPLDDVTSRLRSRHKGEA